MLRILSLALVSLPLTAAAQYGTLNRFAASETTEDDFQLSRPADLGHMRVSAQLSLDYAHDPLVWDATVGDSSTERFSIVGHQLTGTLGLAVGFFDRLVVFAGLPVTLLMDGASDVALSGLPPADGAGLGDAYLGARVRLLGERDDIGSLGLQVTGTFPTAGDSSYRGERFLTIHPQLLGEVRPVDGLRIVVNGGVLVREGSTSATNLRFDDELTYGLGVNYAAWSSRGSRVEILAQAYGATQLESFGDRDGTTLEATAGAKFFHDTGWMAGLAGGPGLARGFGSPDVRLVATVGWAMPEPAEPSLPHDSDGDGIDDERDRCVGEPEDGDGYQDDDGCPDTDNDGDGILDGADRCPMEPETANGVDDADGCPDRVGDRDEDGIDDTHDACPADAEDPDGFQDADGCPDPDNDGDGVIDTSDDCPLEAGVVANRGCPDTDRDGDGVVDRRDNCPDEAGPESNQGCAAAQQVIIQDGALQILDVVHFQTDRARIRHRSFALLDNVAAVLQAHPEITRVRVEGHTDDRGDHAHNMELSEQRAQAVVHFLVEKGIEASRLHAEGFGPDRPLVADAQSEEDLARNRRVEFTLAAE